MNWVKRLLLGLALVGVATVPSAANAKRIAIPVPPKPGVQASQAEVVVLGKVIEIEKDTVEAAPYKGAPADQKVSYKVAVIKISDPLMGAKGLTQVRVGFMADAAPKADRENAPARGGRGGVPIALTMDQEGCFFLNQHPTADFYMLLNNSGMLDKKDETYTKQLDEVKGVLKTLDNPVAALKAKDKAERAQAAQTLLNYYRARPMLGAVKNEELPAEENKLLLEIIAEMPWQADPSDGTKPSRGTVWFLLQPEKFGFKQPEFKPQRPGDPPLDYNKIWDDATSKFLKDNMDKIKISKMVSGK